MDASPPTVSPSLSEVKRLWPFDGLVVVVTIDAGHDPIHVFIGFDAGVHAIKAGSKRRVVKRMLQSP